MYFVFSITYFVLHVKWNIIHRAKECKRAQFSRHKKDRHEQRGEEDLQRVGGRRRDERDLCVIGGTTWGQFRPWADIKVTKESRHNRTLNSSGSTVEWASHTGSFQTAPTCSLGYQLGQPACPIASQFRHQYIKHPLRMGRVLTKHSLIRWFKTYTILRFF